MVKGSQQPSDYLTKAQAAKSLKVSTQGVDAFVRRGCLTRYFLTGRRGTFFKRDDVHLLGLAKPERKADARAVKALALMALSTAQRTEQRLTELLSRMGLDIEPIKRDEDSIQSVYVILQEPMTTARAKDPTWLRFWGRYFFSMDETFLELFELITGEEEPWKTFMDFANSIVRTLVKEGISDLDPARQLFQAGRSHLRYVCYLYCRRVQGARVADVVFDGRATAVEELFALLH